MRFALATLPILGLITGGLVFGQVLTRITGQPFSADEVIIRNAKPNVHNVLPMMTRRVYRDSAGRTRADAYVPRTPQAPPSAALVDILDPIACVRYFLDTENKVARRRVSPWLAIPEVITPDMKFLTIRGTPIYSGIEGDREITSESLGTAVIEGVPVNGRRTVLDASRSSCGETEWVLERWISQELRMVLLEKTADCLGTRTIRLEHIDRAEPDPRIFQIPSDYAIIEEHPNEPAK